LRTKFSQRGERALTSIPYTTKTAAMSRRSNVVESELRKITTSSPSGLLTCWLLRTVPRLAMLHKSTCCSSGSFVHRGPQQFSHCETVSMMIPRHMLFATGLTAAVLATAIFVISGQMLSCYAVFHKYAMACMVARKAMLVADHSALCGPSSMSRMYGGSS
jgi:hypothetical protein